MVVAREIGGIKLSELDAKFFLALCDVDGVHHKTDGDRLCCNSSTHHDIGSPFVTFLEMVETRC